MPEEPARADETEQWRTRPYEIRPVAHHSDAGRRPVPLRFGWDLLGVYDGNVGVFSAGHVGSYPDGRQRGQLGGHLAGLARGGAPMLPASHTRAS